MAQFPPLSSELDWNHGDNDPVSKPGFDKMFTVLADARTGSCRAVTLLHTQYR
jgi:hypothetical protein